MKDKATLLILLLGICLALGACGQSIEARTGVVVEKDTGKPIDEAVVAIRWTEIHSSWAGPHEQCLRVETVSTNEKGEFRVPLFFRDTGWHTLFADNPKIEVTAFKSGYFSYSWEFNGKMPLSRFAGTPQQYAEHLDRLAGIIHCRYDVPDENLQAFRDAVTKSALSYPKYEPPRSVCVNCSTRLEPIPEAKPTGPRDFSKGSDMTVHAPKR